MLLFTSSTLFRISLLALCLLLGLGLLRQAWRRPNRRHRAGRLLASALAAGALWLSAFPPLRPVPAVRAEAILLTADYSPDTLRQLQRRLGPGTAVWAYGLGTPGLAAPVGARPLASLLTLAEQRPALRRLHVLGQGLLVAELPALGTMAVRLHPGRTFVGFRTAFWPEKIALGESLSVEGVAKTPGAAAAAVSGPAWVILRAAGAGRDSVRLPAGGGAFRLRWQPRATGRAVHELVLRRSGQPLIAEPVPVEVTEPRRPATLLLAAAPSFEFKFLKNYLAEGHYPVALRSTVSRGLGQTDFVNQPPADLSRLTPALLAQFALVVADAGALAALSAPEVRALQAALRAGRLGLLVLADAAPLPPAAPARADFAVLPRPAAGAPVPQLLTWPEAPAGVRAALPAQLRPAAALHGLVLGPGQALVAASRRLELGFVVVSVVPETFRWALQGRPAVYAAFWNRLLTAAAPPPAPAAAWRLGTRWPRPGQPLRLQLAAPGGAAGRAARPSTLPTVAASAGGPAVRLALRQDTRLPEWSTAQFWPAAAGWHALRGPGRLVQSFYVYPPTAWAGPELTARAQAGALRPKPPVVAGALSPDADVAREPWPAAWFFGLFLLAAGYLWLEEKL